jgi:hypothetical protein
LRNFNNLLHGYLVLLRSRFCDDESFLSPADFPASRNSNHGIVRVRTVPDHIWIKIAGFIREMKFTRGETSATRKFGLGHFAVGVGWALCPTLPDIVIVLHPDAKVAALIIALSQSRVCRQYGRDGFSSSVRAHTTPLNLPGRTRRLLGVPARRPVT